MDYLPQSDQGLLKWTVKFLKYLMSRLTKFNFPKAEYDLLEQEKDVYAQKLEVATESATRTSVNIKEKNTARKVLKTHIRGSVGEYLIRNHLLTDGDRDLLGIPIHDTKPTPAPPITSKPKLEVDFMQLQQHTLTVHDTETKSAARPAHAAGFEIWRKVGDPAPITDEDYQLVVQAPHSPHVLAYAKAESAQRVYYRVRWINTRGVPGPWSETVSALIA